MITGHGTEKVLLMKFEILGLGVATHQNKKRPWLSTDCKAIFTDHAGWLFWSWMNKNNGGSHNFKNKIALAIYKHLIKCL